MAPKTMWLILHAAFVNELLDLYDGIHHEMQTLNSSKAWWTYHDKLSMCILGQMDVHYAHE